MFCKKCGEKLLEGALFCAECGTKQEFSETKNDVAKVETKNVIETIKNIKPIYYAIATVVAVLLFVVISVVNVMGKTVDLNAYISISFEGYNTRGLTSVVFDEEGFAEKYGKKIKTVNSNSDLYSIFYEPIEMLLSDLSYYYEVDKREGLSNGDEVVLSWDINKEEIKKKYGLNVKAEEKIFVVSELNEIEMFDPFQGVEINFTGIAPYGSAVINSYPSENGLIYNLDNNHNISNGDSVIVAVSYLWDSEDGYIELHGSLPITTSKEYTVSGLDEYVESYKDLTQEFVSRLKTEAEDIIYSYAANSYSSTLSLSDLAYSGYIFNVIKDKDGYSNSYNDFYIIYSGTVSSSDESYGSTKVYYPVKFTNVLNRKGELSSNDNYVIAGKSKINGMWNNTSGYINPLLCYMEIVEANSEHYSAECGDGFELYANHEAITKLDDLNESYKEELYEDAKGQIESYIESSYNDESSASELSYVGDYLLIAKTQSTDFTYNNKYYVVYSASVSNSKGRFDTTNVYFPVEYDGIVKLPGDEYMVTVNGGVDGNSSFPDSWYKTKGYIDASEMYTKIISANRDKFTYEISEGLKEFGE